MKAEIDIHSESVSEKKKKKKTNGQNTVTSFLI